MADIVIQIVNFVTVFRKTKLIALVGLFTV